MSLSSTAVPFTTCMAPSAQFGMQSPHPLHNSASIETISLTDNVHPLP